MKSWRGILGVAVVCACVGYSARAVAGEVSKVESLIREGVELRTEGRDARALPLFQQAYELERSPRTAGQLGLCELALGDWLDAEAHLSEGLESVSHPWIEKHRVVLGGALDKARENLGEVTLAGGPTGAAVVIDRREVGRLPLARPLRLIKGPHDLEVQVAGREPWRKAITIAGADKQRLTVVVTGAPASVAVVAMPDPAAREVPTSGRTRRTLAWTGAAVGLVALGAGTYETVTWIRKSREFDGHKPEVLTDPPMMDPDCSNDLENHGGAGCAAIHDALTRARLLTFVSFGAAALLAAGSAYLFASSQPGRRTDTALSCAPDPTSKGLSCVMTF